jgi:hypothetical protein
VFARLKDIIGAQEEVANMARGFEVAGGRPKRCCSDNFDVVRDQSCLTCEDKFMLQAVFVHFSGNGEDSSF